MSQFHELSNPSGCLHVQSKRRKVRRPAPTGAAELDLDALLASGAMEPHHQRRSPRQMLADLLTWLRAPDP